MFVETGFKRFDKTDLAYFLNFLGSLHGSGHFISFGHIKATFSEELLGTSLYDIDDIN